MLVAADLPGVHRSAIVSHAARPLKAKPIPKPMITLNVVGGPDTNGFTQFSGHTYAKAKVAIDVNADGSVDQVLKADKKGNFAFNVSFGFGDHAVKATGTLKGKKAAISTIVVNRADSIAPVVVLNGLTPGSSGKTQATLTGYVTDIGTGVRDVQVSVDGGVFQTLGRDGWGNFSYGSNFALNGSADGSHTFRFIAHDQAGNSSSLVTRNYVLDTVAPSIAIPAGASAGSVVNNVTVKGSVADARSGLSSLQWKLDSGAYSPLTADASGQFSLTTNLRTDGSDNGSHVITVRAVDKVGNASTQVVNFTLNAPISSPVFSAPLSGALVTQNIPITGDVSTILTGVQVKIDSGPFVPLATNPAGHFSFNTSFATDGSADGIHTIVVQGTAPGTSTVYSTPISFTLDTQKPVVTVGGPANNSTLNQSPTFTGSVSDATAGLSSVTWKLDSGAPVTLPLDASGNFSVPLNLAVDGTADKVYTLTIDATDLAGNIRTSTVSFTLDTVAPTINPLIPSNIQIGTNYSFTVSSTVTDATSGITVLKWQLDSGTFTTIKPDSSGHFSFNVSWPSSSTGNHEITVIAIDAAGNTGTKNLFVGSD